MRNNLWYRIPVTNNFVANIYFVNNTFICCSNYFYIYRAHITKLLHITKHCKTYTQMDNFATETLFRTPEVFFRRLCVQ